MTENKRFAIKLQDDLFGVVDNYSADKVCVINGIRTEIEAKWLCKDMNALNDENEQLKKDLKRCKDWINSDKNDYELTLAFIKNKGYSLKDVLEYEKELKSE